METSAAVYIRWFRKAGGADGLPWKKGLSAMTYRRWPPLFYLSYVPMKPHKQLPMFPFIFPNSVSTLTDSIITSLLASKSGPVQREKIKRLGPFFSAACHPVFQCATHPNQCDDGAG